MMNPEIGAGAPPPSETERSPETETRQGYIAREDGGTAVQVLEKNISGEDKFVLVVEGKVDEAPQEIEVNLDNDTFESFWRMVSGEAAPEAKKEAPSDLEIEQKYLIDPAKLPADLESYPKTEIKQGYIALELGGTEVRVRQKKTGDKEKFVMTAKSKGGESRQEVEFDLDQDTFENLWKMTAGRTVEKTRYKIPYTYTPTNAEKPQEVTIELDDYAGKMAGKFSAEAEFTSQEAADGFVPPEWFGKNVTEDKRYKNRNLAVEGWPEE